MKNKLGHSMLFLPDSNNTGRPWATLPPQLEDPKCGNSDFAFVDTEIVRDKLLPAERLQVHGARVSRCYGSSPLYHLPKVLGV